jgi:hypothetical protein
MSHSTIFFKSILYLDAADVNGLIKEKILINLIRLSNLIHTMYGNSQNSCNYAWIFQSDTVYIKYTLLYTISE